MALHYPSFFAEKIVLIKQKNIIKSVLWWILSYWVLHYLKMSKIKVKKRYLGKQSHKKFIFKEQGNQIKCQVTALLLFVIKMITTVGVCLDSLFPFTLKHHSFWALQTVQSAKRQQCLSLNHWHWTQGDHSCSRQFILVSSWLNYLGSTQGQKLKDITNGISCNMWSGKQNSECQ